MRSTVIVILLGLAACQAPPGKQEPAPLPRQATAAQQELLKRIDVLFVAGGGAELDELVRQAAAEPVSAKAVAMFLLYHLRDAEQRQQRRQLRQQFPLRGLQENERWLLARSCLAQLGPAAVPTVREELIESRHGDTRAFGVSALAAMGPAVVPAVQEAFTQGHPRSRRYYVQALADMPGCGAAEVQLLTWARHPEYDVRGPALRGLVRYGERHLPMLRRAVVDDGDPFVRRQVVEALAVYKDRSTAATVVEYYADCARRGDDRGVRAAERTLVQMAGVPAGQGKRVKTYGLAFWRKWVMSLPAGQEQR